ncbi:MAG: 4Fe-4S binding protein [Polyangiaceae bacterium]
MSEQRLGRRSLLGLFSPKKKEAHCAPTPDAPGPAPNTQPTETLPGQQAKTTGDTFSLDAFYTRRVLSGENDSSRIPVFSVLSRPDIGGTETGTPELSQRSPTTPPWMRAESEKLPAGMVPSVRPYACLAFRSVCSVCVERCPVEHALVLVHGRPKVDPSRCDGCGACVSSCPAPTNGFDLVPRPSREGHSHGR